MAEEDEKCIDTLLTWAPFVKQVEDRILAAGYASGSFTHGVLMHVVGDWLAAELPSSAAMFIDTVRQTNGQHGKMKP